MEKPRHKTGKGPFVLLGVLVAVLGGLAGFFSALTLDPFSVHLRETPFAPDVDARILKGKEFLGAAEFRKLPKDDQDRYRDGMNKAKSGDAAGAAAVFEALAAAHPDAALIQGQIAWLRLRLMNGKTGEDDSARAAAALQAALAAAPQHPWIQYLAGVFGEALRRPDSAEAHYRQSLALSPRFAYPYIGLGRLQLARGETRLAENNFRKAIALMETRPEDYKSGGDRAIPVSEAAPFDLLADLYYRNGADDSARMALEYGEEKGWKTDRMALMQGRLWEAGGFLHQADSAYRALLAKDPGNREYAEALATLGWKPVRSGGARAATGSNDPAAAVFAVSLLDPVARQYPRNAPLWMVLGQAYYHRGLFGLATECFDSSLKYDAALPGLAAKRGAAFEAWTRETARPQVTSTLPHAGGASMDSARPRGEARPPLSAEEQAPVIIPGSIALLGTYNVPWGSSPAAVRGAYPHKEFQTQANGNLLDVFDEDGIQHEYLLGFKGGKLWGIRVFITDSAGTAGDLFGRMIRTKTKISGEGKGTGEASCPGYRPFQGVIWENDDTFEFMAQFNGKENQVRLVRLGRDYLPANRRLCDLVPFLNAESWQ